ncbi:putative glycosyltransferase EpsE [Planctomycetes bacterium CA13]|uniref:Putative glycosyltransferase EpsE n=1 Tax=Novipirellula herctigrandis TaxID=2527986 RepID=A0A5C5YYD6_9BACT|nr:putative glycosyltransferase EpsE [Planctomycetes bacterium CA13]
MTAIITVYNEETWIRSAVDSLLNQSLSDLEVLVLDDGSDDGTSEILDSYTDPRVRVIHGARMGRAPALAKAVELARGKYVANLDADDDAYPDRLRDQVAFLEANPDHAWIGGGEDREDTQRDEQYVRYYPEHDADVRRMAAKCIPYCHSAITFRRDLIDQGINYDPKQPFLIDFEFFLRVAAKHKVANLQVPVVKRRAHAKSFFQRSFKVSDQNRELSRLCRIARREFGLPLWMEAYPIARTVYPMLPTFVKSPIRKVLGLSESK